MSESLERVRKRKSGGTMLSQFGCVRGPALANRIRKSFRLFSFITPNNYTGKSGMTCNWLKITMLIRNYIRDRYVHADAPYLRQSALPNEWAYPFARPPLTTSTMLSRAQSGALR